MKEKEIPTAPVPTTDVRGNPTSPQPQCTPTKERTNKNGR